jgi:hypothetical protein
MVPGWLVFSVKRIAGPFAPSRIFAAVVAADTHYKDAVAHRPDYSRAARVVDDMMARRGRKSGNRTAIRPGRSMARGHQSCLAHLARDAAFAFEHGGVAAAVSGIVTVVGFIVSTRTARAIHTEKLDFDRDQGAQKLAFDERLAERKVNADIALAEKKIALDASLADRKRRQDLAEEVLSGFYQMKDIIREIRSPMSYDGEGKDRPKSAGESADVARMRDTYFPIIARFEAHRKEIADLLSRRYRMSAWFGKEAEGPFDEIQQSLNTVLVSARLLVQWAGDNVPAISPDNAALWRKMQDDIWEGRADLDPINVQITHAISSIEAICRPVLQVETRS